MKRVLSLLVVFGFVSLSMAQDLPDFSIYKKRVLNNHVFPVFANQKGAFINTTLNVNISVGSTSVITIPPVEIGDHTTPPINGVILFTDALVGYEQRFTPWLSLYFNSKMLGRFGTNVFTLLYDGINTVYGGSIGWHIRIMQTKKFILSSSLFVENLEGSFINVSEYVNDIINDVPYAAIVKDTPALRSGLSLESAYAFNATWGLQGEVTVSYGESFVRDKSGVTAFGGVFGDVDLFPRNHFPLGFGLGYMLGSRPELSMGSNGVLSMFVTKFSYTGSSDFDLGLEYMTYKLKLNDKIDNPFIYRMTFSFRFYF
jgi:hypothetical protein